MTPAGLTRRRAAAVLVASTGAGVLATVLTFAVQRRAVEQAHTLAPLAPDLAARAAQIGQILVRDRSQTLTIARTPDGFVLRERRDHPVAMARVQAFLASLSAAGSTILDVDPSQAAAYRLDDSGAGGDAIAVSILSAEGGVMFAAQFGYDPSTAAVYARRAGLDAILAVASAPPAPNQPAMWLDLVPAPVERQAVAAVTVTPLDGPAYRLERTDPQAAFAVAAPFEALAVIAPIGVSATAHAFDGLAPRDVGPASNMATGSLVGRVQVETFAGLVIDVDAAQTADGRFWIAIRAQGRTPDAITAAAAITTRAAPWAYEISDLEARALTAPLASLVRYGR